MCAVISRLSAVFLKGGASGFDIMLGIVARGAGTDLAAGLVDDTAAAERGDAGVDDLENFDAHARTGEIQKRDGGNSCSFRRRLCAALRTGPLLHVSRCLAAARP